MSPVPLILVGKEYWTGLVDWIKEVMLSKEGNISEPDLTLLKMVDTAEEVVDYTLKFYTKHALQPNF
jgi:predicted Rossmann-fold nucleotide-binding protein